MPPNKKLKVSESVNEKRRGTVSNTKVDSLEDFGADWRAQCKSVRDINRYALNKNILTDVTFDVGEESVVFHAHRLILALKSPVFEAMFYGSLAEKGDAISIPDVEPEGFHNLLRFIYSDDISFENDVVAFKTYFAADKYCVSYLKDQCEKYLCGCELRPCNVWIYLEGSQYLNSQSMKNRCLAYLQCNTENALQHDSFLDISAKTLEILLCMDSLSITEMKLLLNVVRWAEYKSNADQGSSLQSIIMPFLRFIHFGALTAAEFISFLEIQNLKDLLKDRDALDILKHINQPSACALPDWCCTKILRNHMDKIKCKHGLSSCSCNKSKVMLKDLSKSKSKIKLVSVSSSSASSFVSTSSSSSSSESSECEIESDSDFYVSYS